MKIGISRGSGSVLDGTFHYELVMMRALAELTSSLPEELVYLTTPSASSLLFSLSVQGGLSYRGLPLQALYEPAAEQRPPESYVIRQRLDPPRIDINAFHYDPESTRQYRAAGIDLIFQISPYVPAFRSLLPFIVPIYDLMHRRHPEFPEVSAFGEGDKRDYNYGNVCRYATRVIVDSDVGKEDVLEFYGDYIDASRISVLPYYPPVATTVATEADILRVRDAYGLPSRYFFYPAQFWKHKNHALILCALGLMAAQSGVQAHAVFCGGYGDHNRAINFMELGDLSHRLGVSDRVHYLGAVPDEDIPGLYAGSVALVMPSFFGPTNLPPLEAWHFNRPVIAADIRGMREQIGDAGLLVDPRSPEALAEAMSRLWRDEALCKALAARGQAKRKAYDWPVFVGRLKDIIMDACADVRAGRSPEFPDVGLESR